MGIRGYERAAQEYEHYLDNGGYRNEECGEDVCPYCNDRGCELYYEFHKEEMEDEDEN